MKVSTLELMRKGMEQLEGEECSAAGVGAADGSEVVTAGAYVINTPVARAS